MNNITKIKIINDISKHFDHLTTDYTLENCCNISGQNDLCKIKFKNKNDIKNYYKIINYNCKYKHTVHLISLITYIRNILILGKKNSIKNVLDNVKKYSKKCIICEMLKIYEKKCIRINEKLKPYIIIHKYKNNNKLNMYFNINGIIKNNVLLNTPTLINSNSSNGNKLYILNYNGIYQVNDNYNDNEKYPIWNISKKYTTADIISSWKGNISGICINNFVGIFSDNIGIFIDNINHYDEIFKIDIEKRGTNMIYKIEGDFVVVNYNNLKKFDIEYLLNIGDLKIEYSKNKYLTLIVRNHININFYDNCKKININKLF